MEKKEYWIIEGFEGELASAEYQGHLVSLQRSLLPPQVEEGDWIYLAEDGSYQTDLEATETARKRAAEQFRRLFHPHPPKE